MIEFQNFKIKNKDVGEIEVVKIMFHKIMNLVISFLVISSFYLICCLIDILITTPITDKIVSITVIDRDSGKIVNIIDSPIPDTFNISKNSNLTILHDVQRFRNAKIRVERNIKDLVDNTIFPINIIDKSTEIENIRIKVPVQIPAYFSTGCKLFYIKNSYNYSYNVLTKFNPIAVVILSFKFCIVD